MKLQNFYYRQNVQDTDLDNLQTNVENEIENVLTDLKTNGIWNKPTITTAVTDTGTITFANLVSRINGKRQNVSSESLTNMDSLIPATGNNYVTFYIEYNQVTSESRVDGNGITLDYISEDGYTIAYYEDTNDFETVKSNLTSSQVELVSIEIPNTATDITDGSIVWDYSTVLYKDYPKTNKVLELDSNVSSSYTINTTDIHTHYFITVNSTAFSLNLPAVSDNYGKVYTIMKIDSGTERIEINPNASETINGKINFFLNLQYENITIFCDGDEWKILSVDNKMTSHEISESFAISDTDGYDIINSDDSVSDNTITLPTPSDSRGRILTIKKITGGSNKTIVDASAGETIDGKQKYWLTEQNQYITVFCDGSEWFIKSTDNISSKIIYTDPVAINFGTTFDGTIHWPYDSIEVYNTGGGGSVMFTLPDISDIDNKNITIILKDNTSGDLTINPASGDTINGYTAGWKLTEINDFITINNDSSTDWSVINKGIGTIVEYTSSTRDDITSDISGTNAINNISGYSITLSPGVWELYFNIAVQIVMDGGSDLTPETRRAKIELGLNTNTSSFNNELTTYTAMRVDTDYKIISGNYGEMHFAAIHNKRKIIEISSNTTYYLNIRINYDPTDGFSQLYLEGSNSETQIHAERIG